MDQKINVFENSNALVSRFTAFLLKKANRSIQDGKNFSVALSGGSTPLELFSYLAEKQKDIQEWQHIHFFWVDERMVPAEDKESNFGNAYKLLLEKINIQNENIHPIRGEAEAESEAARYSCEVVSYVREMDSLPNFDLVILGLGQDGHTASIFPNQLDLIYSNRVCETAEHPKTGQQRITLSGKTINNARNVAFLVTGANKASIVGEIINQTGDYDKYPAAHINPESGRLYWFLDADAAKYIST